MKMKMMRTLTPKKSRLISEVYNETEEVEIDQELCLMGIDEPEITDKL